ncbi:MAG: protein kinase [Labilithrix sp.]
MNSGTIVDAKYQVTRLLGQGGMGAVYEARHQGTGRRVALKVIVREALVSGDREIISRFQREARASGAIDSKHVVQVVDTGVDPQTGSPYLVMEYLAGEDLHHLIDRLGPLSPDLALRIIAQACSGLARAHSEAIIHRDIKAANLYIARGEDGDLVVKLLDFGIAKVRADPMSAASGSVTRTGTMLGSPLYMSPEQVVGKKDVDARADIYSLGITLYEALTGRTPYHDEETIGALVLAICSGRGMPLRTAAPWLAPSVTAIVERATAIEPSHRFASAEEMRAAIMTLLPAGAALHERMLVKTRPPLDRTAALDPSSAIASGASSSSSASTAEVQLAAQRLLPRAPGSATTPFGAVTPPPGARSFPGNTMDAFGGTSSIPVHRSPIAAVLGGIVALAIFIALGVFIVKSRSSTSATVAASTVPLPSATVVTSSERIAAEPVSAAPATSASSAPRITIAPPAKPTPNASVAPASPIVSAPSVAPVVAKPATKPNCNPPFTIDSSGVQHFKEECL